MLVMIYLLYLIGNKLNKILSTNILFFLMFWTYYIGMYDLFENCKYFKIIMKCKVIVDIDIY